LHTKTKFQTISKPKRPAEQPFLPELNPHNGGGKVIKAAGYAFYYTSFIKIDKNGFIALHDKAIVANIHTLHILPSKIITSNHVMAKRKNFNLLQYQILLYSIVDIRHHSSSSHHSLKHIAMKVGKLLGDVPATYTVRHSRAMVVTHTA